MQQNKKINSYARQESHRQKILPAVLLCVSLLLMMLPLDGMVASLKAVLSYVFVPPVLLAHKGVQYTEHVSQTVQELLQTHEENERLKEELKQMQLEQEQTRQLYAENERLTQALQLRAPKNWKGVWATTVYREPTQWNILVMDKGSEDGVEERAAAVSLVDGRAVLAGVVVEVNAYTSKVLLVQDRDFSAAVYTEHSQAEGLLEGKGTNDLWMRYVPLASSAEPEEAVYTSAASSIFPAGLLVGYVQQREVEPANESSLTLKIRPVKISVIRELFILVPQKEYN